MRYTLPLLIAGLTATTAVQADWKDDLKSAAKQQAQTQAETSLGLPQPSPAGAKVYFINLKDGDTVKSPFVVQFGLKGMGVTAAGLQKENTGHHHLLIDSPVVDYSTSLPMTEQIKHFGGGQTEMELSLKPGKHTLQLLLADWKHQPHNPAVQSEKITITVQ
ncbi:DUF4399 domain-containing protein [Stagnimonas aquatica]|uniref:DUF4399 domain-containing protein n=1 Tax=Stagnimonas aquatica TaxID=2689987 RepID=A0A3N0V7Z4_9GAMM|nr:DUF4399 domain-containing protein [Stagnimonas aquatica]ROH88805.1 DUF4399 domain-containing protein [Stagnimonas aquatica]